MHFDEMVAYLEELARKLGIAVRWERMETGGGLCQLRGKKVILANELLPSEMKAEVLAKAMADLDLTGVYLLPEVREFIGRFRESSGE